MGHRVYCRYMENGIQTGLSIGGLSRINEFAKEMIQDGYISSMSDLAVDQAYDKVYHMNESKLWYTGVNTLLVIGRTEGNNRFLRNIMTSEFVDGCLTFIRVMDIHKRILISNDQFGRITIIYKDARSIKIENRDEHSYISTLIELHNGKDFSHRCINEYNLAHMFK